MDSDVAFADELCQPGLRAWDAIWRARAVLDRGEFLDIAAAEEAVRAALRGTHDEGDTERFLELLHSNLK